MAHKYAHTKQREQKTRNGYYAFDIYVNFDFDLNFTASHVFGIPFQCVRVLLKVNMSKAINHSAILV